jgi:hypothetical protein
MAQITEGSSMAVDIKSETGTWQVKTGLAQMLKGGVIMDVVTAEQAKIAEDAGAARSWLWSAFLRTSERPAAWRECPTRR